MATGKSKKALICQFISVAIFAVSAGIYTSSADAADYAPDLLSPSLIDEFRFGVNQNDFHATNRREDGANINVEILFRRPDFQIDNAFFSYLLNPRFHIGGHLNTAGDTSQAYVGFTWDHNITEMWFVEASFGGVIHSGDLRGPGVRALGCRLNFRESLSTGIELTERMRIMVTYDHISNANLCSSNAGLNTLGVRLGYKF